MADKTPNKPITNPNGANQFQLDPRQKLCWENYINPKSATFGNGLQSALKAGYSESHSATITTEEWFQAKVRRLGMLSKGEKVLNETLDYDVLDKETGKIDSGIARIKLDAAKHVTSTLGKNEGYSTKVEQELSNPDGTLKTIIINKSNASNN